MVRLKSTPRNWTGDIVTKEKKTEFDRKYEENLARFNSTMDQSYYDHLQEQL